MRRASHRGPGSGRGRVAARAAELAHQTLVTKRILGGSKGYATGSWMSTRKVPPSYDELAGPARSSRATSIHEGFRGESAQCPQAAAQRSDTAKRRERAHDCRDSTPRGCPQA